MSIRVLLVDDQSLLRMGFRMVLEATEDITVIGEAGDGDDAVALARELNPDIVLMDVRMPKLDGVEATRRICAENPDARVLVLTTFDLDEYAFSVLHAGGSGFLLKDVSSDELCNAIRSVAQGDAVISPRVTRELLNRHSSEMAEPFVEAGVDPIEDLTPREREVLMQIAAGQTNAEIAAQLFLSEATVKTHVTRILSKLALRDRVQAVIFAFEHGLRAE